MGRKKLVSESMGELIEAIGDFRQAEATIKAHYLALAEQEIAEKRERVMEMMFVKHRDSGASEIANTTGLSRSTVIRWRKDWEAKLPEFEPVPQQVEPAEVEEPEATEPEFLFTKERDTDSNVDYHVVTNELTGESVYLIWHETFGAGETPEDAKSIERPEWLTDEVIQKAEDTLGFPVPGQKRR